MKKRKIKLFASVASLAMVAAVMGVGVWAATAQTVSVTSTVGFAADGVVGALTLKVTGDSVKSAGDSTNPAAENYIDYTDETADQIATFALGDKQNNTQSIDIKLQLKDFAGTAEGPDGFYSSEDGTITYTFNFTNGNSAGGAAITYAVTATSNEYWTVVSGGTPATDTGTVNAAANADFSVVFQFKHDYDPAGTNYTTLNATHNLPTITIALNTVTA